MKKNRKMLGLAAAALLAVAPVVASTVPVNAAASGITVSGTTPSNGTNNTTTTVTTPTTRPYFSYQGSAVSDQQGLNVIGTNDIVIKSGMSLQTLADNINKLNITFHKADGQGAGTALNLKPEDLRAQLVSSNVTFKSNDSKSKDYNVIDKVPSTAFNLHIDGTDGTQTATILIPINVQTDGSQTPASTDTPVIGWSINGTQQTSNNKLDSVNGQTFQVAAGSTFNPTDFINSNGERIQIFAQQNSTNPTYASVSATSNPVNTSEAGRYYNVTLSSTNFNGKTTSVTYMVLVTSSHKQTLYANGQSSIQTYHIYGNNVVPASTTFKDGDQVYVADETKTIDKVSYSKVSTQSKSAAKDGNTWVKTSSLVKPANTGDTNVESHTVMITSRAYDKDGKYLGHTYNAYTTIDIVPTVVTIGGKTYYKVANKNEYVRVTNITGTQRTLRHNAYIYWSSYRRTPGTGKMYRGQTVTTYGASMRFRNGKKYYRIQGCRNNNKRYIKAVNFY